MKTAVLLARMIAIGLCLAVHTTQAQNPGDTVELEGATAAAPMVPVCTTTQAVDAVIKALADDDNDAIAALAALGKVYAVDVGTKAKVLGVRGQYGTCTCKFGYWMVSSKDDEDTLYPHALVAKRESPKRGQFN